jgi:hypothetical protein
LFFLGVTAGYAGAETKQNLGSKQKPSRTARVEAVEDARTHFRMAKDAGGEYVAPFEYYMAEEYLVLAERELREGDYFGVIEMAGNSKRYSATVIARAGGGVK